MLNLLRKWISGFVQLRPTVSGWVVTTYELDLPPDETLAAAQPPYSRAAVYAIVAKQLAECQCLDHGPSEVRRSQTLVDDLDVEEIDFLDLVHRLEHAFKIEILREELHAQDILRDDHYVKEGRVTIEGLARLQSRMPWRNLSPTSSFGKNREAGSLDRFLIVEDLCKLAASKVAMAA